MLFRKKPEMGGSRAFVEKMQTAYKLQAFGTDRQCPRGITSALLLDLTLTPIATGRNLLMPSDAPCECDCGIDTLLGGSSSCKAIHAEAAALEYLKFSGRSGDERYVVTTRPPCKLCIDLLLASNVAVIITTDQYPDRDHSEKKWPGVWIVLSYEECKCPAPE